MWATPPPPQVGCLEELIRHVGTPTPPRRLAAWRS